MQSKFQTFALGAKFAKTMNEFFADKTIIKWTLINQKNLLGQLSILVEYKEVKDESKLVDYKEVKDESK